jgi:hypothetical protein
VWNRVGVEGCGMSGLGGGRICFEGFRVEELSARFI